MTAKNSYIPASQEGFTLIGVLVALTMVSVVTIGIAQLMTRAEQVVQIARSEFIATNLAREGLELVRSVRDTNWFTDDNRAHWIDDRMCGQFTYDANDARHHHSPGGIDKAQLFIHGSNQEWRHSGSSSEITLFSRILEVDCTEKDNDPADPNANPAFVLVTSRVFWEERGQEREVVLKEKLYNWFP